MKFKKLVIENFGVYEGVHEFDLNTSSSSSEQKKNLILIKGPNGSGKSTFFTSIALVLFGRQALGQRISNSEYNEFVLSRFHKARFADNKVRTQSASISLTLDYVKSGKKNEIFLQRSWEREGENITEQLTIFKNNQPPEVQDIDYETWLNDLFPPGLNTILCFDAEDMNTLVRTNNDQELKKVVKRLLGLHLVEQLEDDLDYFLRKKGGGTKYDSLKDSVIIKQQVIDRFKDEIENLTKQQSKLKEEEKDINSDINRLERELSSEGGDYAARRPIIKERISQLENEIEKKENKLRDLCSGLLPFSLAPVLSAKLSDRLKSELDIHRKRITLEYLNDKINDLSSKLDSSSLWNELEIKVKDSKKIIHFLGKLLKDDIIERDSDSKLVHELAENDILKLRQWIQEVEHSIPELALHISSELKSLKNELKENHEYLNRAPDDKKLEPIYDEIRKKENDIQKVRKQIGKNDEELGSIEFKLEEVKRDQERLTDQLSKIEKEKRKFSLAERSKLALKSYHESLARTQIQELCEELVNCFNQICEKDQLLSDAEIDIETFEVRLIDQNQESVTIDDLSMGESQIYGISLLWALRKISGYNLPLLIDTPIARLDKIHRSNFINKYLPDVSDQVLLFATNAEMESHVQKEFEPSLAHIYELKFSEEIGSSVVIGSGYKKVKANESQIEA